MPYLRSHNETMIYHSALVTEKLATMTMIMMSRYHYHYILFHSLRCVMSCRLTWIDITIYYIVIGPAHRTNLWDTSDIFRSKFDINNIHNLFVLFLASYLYTHTHTHIPINLVASSHIRVFSIQLCAWRQCRIYIILQCILYLNLYKYRMKICTNYTLPPTQTSLHTYIHAYANKRATWWRWLTHKTGIMKTIISFYTKFTVLLLLASLLTQRCHPPLLGLERQFPFIIYHLPDFPIIFHHHYCYHCCYCFMRVYVCDM